MSDETDLKEQDPSPGKKKTDALIAEAYKILHQKEENNRIMATHHRALYDAYIKQRFSHNDAMVLIGQHIIGSLPR